MPVHAELPGQAATEAVSSQMRLIAHQHASEVSFARGEVVLLGERSLRAYQVGQR